MIKKTAHYFCLALLLIALSCNDHDAIRQQPTPLLVPFADALASAKSFDPSDFYSNNHSNSGGASNSPLKGENVIKNYFTVNDSEELPALYVFNFEKGGTLILSADYRVNPIVAFLDHGNLPEDFANFYSSNIPPAAALTFKGILNHFSTVHKGQAEGDKNGPIAVWHDFFNKTNSGGIKPMLNVLPGDGGTSGGCVGWVTNVYWPTVGVTWGQKATYNELCDPKHTAPCAHPLTGCVATAMAQVIAKWKPTNSLNLNYTAMPATYGNYDVENLMAIAGTSVNMVYGCTGSGILGSSCPSIATALKGTFGFYSANYAGFDYNRLVQNIESGWPVILIAGITNIGSVPTLPDDGGGDPSTGSLGGHAYVCDGYKNQFNTCTSTAANEQFHINWGWHEVGSSTDFNGWFAIDPVNHSMGIVTPNGSESFSVQAMISEIHQAGDLLY